ncbi:lytic murein transglycosylase [Paracoccus mutanolyticus]|uniref:lytic murein transglycosylase n=1 Tax=Paracoccus mutanolyticus TaxID=1499308 RepID=UPI001CB94C37|nr:lytic murein transglycosylase [Paracoccus mutanolyticus]
MPVDLDPGLRRNFKGQARGQGISDQTLEFAFRDVVYNPEVVKRSQNQAEFKKSLWEYLENAVSEKRQTNGRARSAWYRLAWACRWYPNPWRRRPGPA